MADYTGNPVTIVASGGNQITIVGIAPSTPITIKVTSTTAFVVEDANASTVLTVDTQTPLTTINSGNLAVTAGEIVMGAAASKIVPGATSLSLRNHADSTDNVTVTDAGTVAIRANLNLSGGQLNVYNAVQTQGRGVPAIYGYARATAQSGANASVATYTVGGADHSYLVSANVLVTTATNHNFTVTCTYTDEGNTSRTLTLSFTLVAGGTLVTAVANANGTVPYSGIPQHIRAKAGTAITIATTGTFTTVAYNVEGLIAEVA